MLTLVQARIHCISLNVHSLLVTSTPESCLYSENFLPFYMLGEYECAPHVIWSLGVILVNLVCGNDPWEEATFCDSNYVAFLNDSNYLMMNSPLSKEANAILCRIFDPNPYTRITIQELQHEVSRCRSFRTQD